MATMQPRSDKYQLVLAVLALALALVLNFILDLMLHSLLRTPLRAALGVTAADIIEGVILVMVPLALAFAIVFALHRAARDEFEHSHADLQIPKIACSYTPQDVNCLVTQRPAVFYENRDGAIMRRHDAADWYRVKAEAPHIASIANVTAHLVAIRRDSETLFDGDMPLSFVAKDTMEDRLALLSPGVPRYVDVLALTENDRIILTARGFVGPGSLPYDILLTRKGVYRFAMMVRGATAHAALALVVNWTGRRATSTVLASYS